MSFASPTFLFFFLPLTLAGHTLLPAFARNAFLLCASLLFYAWGEPRLCIWLLLSIGFNTAVAFAIVRSPVPKAWLTFGIVVNLAALAYFKYAGFLLSTLSLSFAGFDVPVLPLGISFITFHAISLLIDVSRKPDRVRPGEIALYFCLFPQLIAGPITRYHHIIGQIRERTVSLHGVTAGVERFVVGLAKKVLLADVLARLADAAFASPPENLSAGMAWAGAVAYALQIYFDFSGYADMAVGLGLMLGFRLPENFNAPYRASSVTDFWRRWHLSLTAWFRDYVYIPLGGNRGSVTQTVRNILIVFALSGLWHGANWTFILWGCAYGVILSLEKLYANLRIRPLQPHARLLAHAYTLFVILCLWVLFRSTSVSSAWLYLLAMFTPASTAPIIGDLPSWLALPAGILLLLPQPMRDVAWVERHWPHASHTLRHAGVLALFLACLTVIAGETYRPFLYFQF